MNKEKSKKNGVTKQMAWTYTSENAKETNPQDEQDRVPEDHEESASSKDEGHGVYHAC